MMSTAKQLLKSVRANQHVVLRAYACADPKCYRVEIEDEQTGQLRARDFATTKAAQIYLQAMHSQYKAQPVGPDYVPPPPPPPKPLIPRGGTVLADHALRGGAHIRITHYAATPTREEWLAVTFHRNGYKPKKFERRTIESATITAQKMEADYLIELVRTKGLP